MLTLGRRYAHVPVGLVSMLLVIVLIAWLLERRVDGVWEAALRMAAPVPVAVTLAAVPPSVAAASPAPPADPPLAPAASAPAPAPVAPPSPAPPAVPADPERYVLESGPFLTADAADRVEDQLNHLGYATVRFRKQEVRRLYAVIATGFAGVRDAERAAVDLGRGAVVDGADGVELVVDRAATLGDAIAAARPVRARGLEVRIEAGPRPVVIYHVRYGQFSTQAAAEARGEELALFGLVSRVVKIR